LGYKLLQQTLSTRPFCNVRQQSRNSAKQRTGFATQLLHTTHANNAQSDTCKSSVGQVDVDLFSDDPEVAYASALNTLDSMVVLWQI